MEVAWWTGHVRVSCFEVLHAVCMFCLSSCFPGRLLFRDVEDEERSKRPQLKSARKQASTLKNNCMQTIRRDFRPNAEKAATRARLVVSDPQMTPAKKQKDRREGQSMLRMRGGGGGGGEQTYIASTAV